MSDLQLTLHRWLDEFIEDMTCREYSQRSIRVYRYDLRLFVEWVGTQADLTTPGDLTTEALEKYQMHLMLRPSRKSQASAKTMSAGARNRHLAQLRSFFRFLKKTCKLLGNPSSELEFAKDIKTVPQSVFSVEEMALLLETIPKNTASGLRDWVAVELLYSTGLRRFELLGLELQSLRLGEELVHVLGKGNKERVVPMGSGARSALERYLKEGRPQLVQGNHQSVLVSHKHGGPASQNELLHAIRQHASKAKIRTVEGFHQFRHTCATHLLRGGADLRCIQTLLGHSNLNTTAIYTKVEVTDLQKTLKTCHPREKDDPAP